MERSATELRRVEKELVRTICIAGYKSHTFGRKKVEKLRCAAEEAKQIGLYALENAAVITSVVAMLDALMKSIWEIDQDIKALVMQESFI